MDPWMDFTRRKQFLVNKWEILALTSSFFIFNVGAKIVLLTNHTFDLTARLYFFDFYCNKSGDEVKGKEHKKGTAVNEKDLGSAVPFVFLSLRRR